MMHMWCEIHIYNDIYCFAIRLVFLFKIIFFFAFNKKKYEKERTGESVRERKKRWIERDSQRKKSKIRKREEENVTSALYNLIWLVGCMCVCV